MNVCKHVFYDGDVQGVGFRYTARALAHKWPVVGYVKNLYDGRVEILVEGEAAVVQGFLDEIGDSMRRYIRQAEALDEPATGEHPSFRIAF